MVELVFFDVETTAPKGGDGRLWMIEFGSIVVCPKKLVEVESFCTMIRPPDISLVAPMRASGITREAVAMAPVFDEVADRIFRIMNGRVWVGHNIQRFDCHRIKEAFADIGLLPPEPMGVIDSLVILTKEFGKRAGNLKMATLASYFGLGQQKHRSMDDVRMNIEVLKHCAAVLLLESKLPNILPGKDERSLTMVTRSRDSLRAYEEENSRKSPLINHCGNSRKSPYHKGKFGKVIESANQAFQGAEGSKPLNGLLRHSRLLLK